MYLIITILHKPTQFVMNSLICCILKKQIMLIFHLDSGKSSQVFGSTRVFRCNCASDGTLLAAWMKNEAWRSLGLRCLEAHPFRVVLLMRQVAVYRTKKRKRKLFCKVSLSPSSGNKSGFHKLLLHWNNWACLWPNYRYLCLKVSKIEKYQLVHRGLCAVWDKSVRYCRGSALYINIYTWPWL